MVQATLRKVGGSVMVALPPAFLEQLRLGADASVGLTLEDGRIVLRPAAARPRYVLAELLDQCDPDAPTSDEDRAWTSDEAVGDESL